MTDEIDARIEKVAKAMAKESGWDGWDTATDFTQTPSGTDPEEERDYWRDLAAVAIDVLEKLKD